MGWKFQKEFAIIFNMYIYFFKERENVLHISFLSVQVHIVFSTFQGFSILRCLIETNKGNIVVTKVQVIIQKEHFSLPWSSFFVICQLTDKHGSRQSFQFCQKKIVFFNDFFSKLIPKAKRGAQYKLSKIFKRQL